MRRLEIRLTRAPEDDRIIGHLAESRQRIYFEWDSEYLDRGVELSPFKLPLSSVLYEHKDLGFGPLPGLFEESLPDGWGRLLMDRNFRQQGLDPAIVSPLDRLAYLGQRTMGALTYHPSLEDEAPSDVIDLFELGRHAEEVLAGSAKDVLPELMRAGGSPGGARPKVLVGLRGDAVVSGVDLPQGYEHWMVKFAAKEDAADAGPLEQAYALMAKAAGILMPPTRLFEVKNKKRKGRATRRYFGVQRFDREGVSRRVHVQTFANLIHADFRSPSSDYADLLKCTQVLTRNQADVLRAFRQMAFNVAAHVRDDHTKNFSFLLDAHDEWTLTPAYDVVYGSGPGGEHTMSVNGEAREPTRDHCLKLAEAADIGKARATQAIDEVNEAVSHWSIFAEQASCSRALKRRIAQVLRRL